MGSRRKARVLAFQALYIWEESQPVKEDLLSFSWVDKATNQESLAFAALLVSGTLEKKDEVDKQIKMHLKHWSFDRLGKVDLAILRTAAYALIFHQDIPISVTINEAIEIAKLYGSPDSFRFINGVLDGIHQAVVV